MRMTFEEQLSDIIRPEVEGMGCRLWGLTAPTKGRKRIIRIYIDSDGGPTIDQCARVSRQVGLLLEVEDIIPSAFTLEVSSPGVERRFFSTGQMADYVGQTLAAQTYEAVDGRRNFTGVLKEIGDDNFTLTVDDVDTVLQWTDVKEVHLVHDFKIPSGK